MTDIAQRKPTIFLHIGPMKTGTSYLQHVMADNQEILRSQGVLFPGKNPRVDQVRGVRDIMQLHSEDEAPAKFQGAWARLRDEMFDFEGRASVVSQEFMSFARKPRARSISTSLAPATVHVVLGVRDATRVLPSSWATSTRNRNTSSWQEYVAALLAGRRAGGQQWRRSMRALDVPRMLKDWSGQVPPERLHVVVVPPPGSPPGLLWERFASVLGVDPEAVTGLGERRGESYGYHSADLMRRVNNHLLQLPRPVYHRAKAYLLEDVLERRAGEPKVPVTRDVVEFADRWNDVTIKAVRSSGARVYGELADLKADRPAVADTSDPPSAEDVLRVAVDALSGLRRGMRELTSGSDGTDTADVAPDHWAGVSDPLAAAANDVADAVRELDRLTSSHDAPTTPRTTLPSDA